MDIYLAGCENRPWCVSDYLFAPGNPQPPDVKILESFYYANDIITSMIPHFKGFMLDSGAFTFFTQGRHVDWDEYVSKYMEYIKANNVELFFELDIDALIGYDKVKAIRQRLERETGRRPIPVWHRRMGKEEFFRMCDEYDYVAIGGIVSKEIKRDEYKYFPWFINEAHKRGARIHGLGFTHLAGLELYHFDSVDSSSWTTGNRFGLVYKFNGRDLIKKVKPPNTRVKSRETAFNNFCEWAKFCQYAETHL